MEGYVVETDISGHTEAFVGWVLTVPRRGISLWGNPARMLAVEFIVVGRRRLEIVNAVT